MQKTLKNRTVFCRDNLEVLKGINSETIDLIYLDPPFNKKKEFTASIGSTAEGASFHDYFREGDIKEEWLGLIAEKYPTLHDYIQGMGNIGHKSNKYYLCYMAIRLIEMYRVLKDTGSIYLHCDPTMSHYLKLLLDCIFGENNFRNEIIWCYHGPGSPDIRQFSRKSDTIFWYSKGDKWIFNGDDVRVPFKDPNQSLRRAMSPDGNFSKKDVEKYRAKGKIPENWWEIRIAARSKKEYVGYPTQKPVALLERIITASSNEGDIVLDPFCGCATTCVAAEKLERKWVGVDISKKAFDLVRMRLGKEIEGRDTLFYENKVVYREDIPARTDAQVKPDKLNNKHYLFGIQEGKCKGCGMRFDYRHFHIDHMFPKSKGGGDNIQNLQLLCGSCNTIKGDRDMPYLMKRLRELGAI